MGSDQNQAEPHQKLLPFVQSATERHAALWLTVLLPQDGITNLGREFNVARQLVWRSWALGHRSSRKEASLMRQSAHDLAKARSALSRGPAQRVVLKVLPVASMVLVLGAEISTIGILRSVGPCDRH